MPTKADMQRLKRLRQGNAPASATSIINPSGFISRRIQGRAITIAAGSNPTIDVQQPGNMACLIGVNVYSVAFQDTTTVTLLVNGQKFLDAVPISELQPNAANHNKGILFTPVGAPLAGNDSIQIDINGGGSTTGNIVIFYKSVDIMAPQYNW
jgi:hypothetical protein